MPVPFVLPHGRPVPTREGWSQQASLAGDTLTVVFTDKDMTRDNVALSALEKVRFGTDEERIWFDLKDAYAPEVTLLFWTDTSGDHEQEILKSLARHVKERPSIADARTVAELQRAIIAGE